MLDFKKQWREGEWYAGFGKPFEKRGRHGMRLFQILATIAYLASAARSAVCTAASKPNVIVIFTDDHGYADLSCQGVFDDVKTPHIDSLASGGVRMTNGYVTAPQCVPSRAGLLTGQYQNKFGLESNRASNIPGGLDGFNNTLTIAERLKQVGYATGMIGKWHLGPREEIVTHGFDDVFYKNSNRNGWANYDLEGNDVEASEEKSGLYHLDACSGAAKAFVRRHHKEPFFLYLAYRAPHVPLDATQQYLDRFPGEMPERRRRALAMLSAVDDGVGGVLQSLRQYGIEENTLLFFIGDNGAPLKIHKVDAPGIGAGWDGSLNDPLNGEKGTVIEGGNRTPFVVCWKGRIPKGQVYDQPVISLDVAATAAALAGLPHDPQLDGVNLIPYLTGEKRGTPHAALHWRWMGQAAIREGQWKYIQGDSRRYLFDLDQDMGEKRNLVAEHPEIAERLAKRLKEWSQTLTPPGLPPDLTPAGKAYFDHYLDGKEASHAKYPSEPKAAKKPTSSAKKRPGAAAMFKQRDTNKDNQLTLEEYIGTREGRNVPALTRRFKAFDEDSDDFLTLPELANGMTSERKDKP